MGTAHGKRIGRSGIKPYLRFLIDEIKIKGKEVLLKGSHSALAGMLLNVKTGTLLHMVGVPTLVPVWLPVCNPLHNRSLSPAVNRNPSIYIRSIGRESLSGHTQRPEARHRWRRWCRGCLRNQKTAVKNSRVRS